MYSIVLQKYEMFQDNKLLSEWACILHWAVSSSIPSENRGFKETGRFRPDFYFDMLLTVFGRHCQKPDVLCRIILAGVTIDIWA